MAKVMVEGDASEAIGMAEKYVESGANLILLMPGSEKRAGKELYAAAEGCLDRLRGRALLFVEERADVAAASGADGVCLDADGGATPNATRSTLRRPLSVAVRVRKIEEASSAVQGGADVVLWDMVQEDVGMDFVDWKERIGMVKEFVDTVPFLVQLDGSRDPTEDVMTVLSSRADGIVFPSDIHPDDLRKTVQAVSATFQDDVESIKGDVRDGRGGLTTEDTSTSIGDERTGMETGERLAKRPPWEEELIAAERCLLEEVLEWLKATSPSLPELGLLEEALQGLDELFLLVVVGEFNAGKSSLINGLLGSRALAEGALPTTNEISLLRYMPAEESEVGEATQMHVETVQEKDGYFVRYIPAPLLRDVAIVDTPGTNVVLERQQQLTEEFVPRADLVLFVMSADRPFSGSEVKFLRYIREWGKKVVFVLNKKDALQEDELEGVVSFVADNANRLLNVSGAKVFPVSARLALQAKEDAGRDRARLLADSAWGSSGFKEFEDYVFDFLSGSQNSAERVRLKLDTPLAIAAALLNAVEEELRAEAEVAEQEVSSLQGVEMQLTSYREIMEKDSIIQRAQLQKQADKACQRIEAVLDEVLKFQNSNALSSYVLGVGKPEDMPIARRYARDVMGESPLQVQRLVEDHARWLAENNLEQAKSYQEFLDWRRSQLINMASIPASGTVLPIVPDFSGRASGDSSGSAARAAASFDHGSAEASLEEEVREAVLGTLSSCAGALAVGFVSTMFLQGFFQDLLGLSVGLLAAYVGLLNVPLRRAEIKAKVRRSVDSYAERVQAAMKADFDREVKELLAAVRSVADPMLTLAQEELSRVQEAQSRRADLEARLDKLRDTIRRLE